jgi:hypothetical protein
MVGPIVATCLDLGVTARFIPLREPWRNGVIEHVNDVWDKSFFRTERFANIDHLLAENNVFIDFHNQQHRYAAHGGASPAEIWQGRHRNPLHPGYRPPTRPPSRGRIRRSLGPAHHSGRPPPPPVRHRHHPRPRMTSRRRHHRRRTRLRRTLPDPAHPAITRRNDHLRNPTCNQRNDLLRTLHLPEQRNDVLPLLTYAATDVSITGPRPGISETGNHDRMGRASRWSHDFTKIALFMR